MTAQTIARDSFALMSMTSHRPLRQAASDPKIARMDDLELNGRYDRTNDGLRRSRQGTVGDVQTTCQVANLGGDILLTFWSMTDGHQRRVLVDASGLAWMDTGGGRAIQIGSNNKHYDVIAKVLAARAH